VPVLELTDDSLTFPILSVMLFPKTTEAESRQQWLAASMAMQVSVWRTPSANRFISDNPDAWASDIWSLRQSPGRTVEDGFIRAQRARLSGSILSFMLTLAAHHPKQRKIERAIALVRESDSQAPSESLLTKVWADFKSASHLWLSILETKGGPKEGDTYWFKLLARAEAFRLRAQAARVLKASETWRTPDNLSLPSVEIEVPPLTQDMLTFLDRYFLS
jgi:hypothetical protein